MTLFPLNMFSSLRTSSFPPSCLLKSAGSALHSKFYNASTIFSFDYRVMTSPSTSIISTREPLTLSAVHTTWTNALSLPPTQRLSSLRRLLRHITSSTSPTSDVISYKSSLSSVSSPATTLLLGPSLTRLHLDLALTYAFLGEYFLASVFFKEAAAASPATCRYTAFAFYGLGLANAELKEWRYAGRHWRKCLECFDENGDDKIVFQSGGRLQRIERVMHQATNVHGNGATSTQPTYSKLEPSRNFSLERSRVEWNVQVVMLATGSKRLKTSITNPSQQQKYGVNGIPALLTFGPDWPAGLSNSHTRSASLDAELPNVPAVVSPPPTDIRKASTAPTASIARADCFPPLADIGKPLPLRPIKTWPQRPYSPPPIPPPLAPTSYQPPPNRMLLKAAMILGESVSRLTSESPTTAVDPPDPSPEYYYSPLANHTSLYTPSLYSPTPKINQHSTFDGKAMGMHHTPSLMPAPLAVDFAHSRERSAILNNGGRDSVRGKIEEAMVMWRERGWKDDELEWEGNEDEDQARHHLPHAQDESVLEENEDYWNDDDSTFLFEPDDLNINSIPPRGSKEHINPPLTPNQRINRRKTRIHQRVWPIDDEDSTLLSSTISPLQTPADEKGNVVQPLRFSNQRFSRFACALQENQPTHNHNSDDDNNDEHKPARLSDTFDHHNYIPIDNKPSLLANSKDPSTRAALAAAATAEKREPPIGEILLPKTFTGFPAVQK